MKCIGFILTFTTLFCLGQQAQAQHLETPRGRQGYWVGLALQSGGANLTEDKMGTRFFPGNGFTLRLGELVTERLGLGLVVEWSMIQSQGDHGGIGMLGVEGSYNPWRRLSIKTAAGFGAIMLTDQNTKEKELRGGAGAAVSIGAAYDFFPWRKRLTGGWAFTPTVDIRYLPDGDIHGVNLLAGLQITYWSGLTRNQLLLPED